MGAGFRLTVRPPINRLLRTGTAVGLTDAQLLERFVDAHDEAGESAFNVLVERHGPMVLAVCSRVLHDPHDAQDAFQATFLVLVRKAGTVRRRESIADWLHGVARRVSARARADLARRRSVERRAVAGSLTTYQLPLPEVDVRDEVEHLPHDLRAPVVLCYLQGLTHEQAASQLGWPVGTVRSRLARARDRLRADLTRRGIAPSAALVPMFALNRISLPDGMIETTVKAAMLLTARDAGEAGLISASAVALTDGVLHTMLVSKMRLTAFILVAVGAISSGVQLCAYQGAVPGAAPPGVPTGAPPKAVKPGATTGIAVGILPTSVDSVKDSSDELDALAARVEELVQRARREQAEGRWDEAVQDLVKSVDVAGEWQTALMRRRGFERIAPLFPDNLVPKALHPQSDTDSSDSSGRRLDNLERKVDRILRALEKDGHDQAERPQPALDNRKPIEESPQSSRKPSGIRGLPRGTRIRQ